MPDSKPNRPTLNRRDFFKGAALGAGAAPAFLTRPSNGQSAEFRTPLQTPGQGHWDFAQGSAALQPDRVVRSACQFCNSLCGLEVHLKQDRVVDVRGLESDPVQAGGLCVKAEMMAEMVTSPHRLRTPMIRVSGEKGSPDSRFREASWEEALDRIAKKFLELRDAGQAHTIANKTSGRLLRGVGSVIGRFFELLGSPNDTDVGPVCNDAGGNALAWTFGLGNFTNGYGVDPSTGEEDLGSADFHLFLGTNQAETHPVTFAHLLRERAKRKATLVVVDPRKTPTGELADLWLAPKPHTDLALILGLMHYIVTHNLEDRRFIDRWVLGFEELKAHLISNDYSTAWAASVTGVPEKQIMDLARGYARAGRATIFCNAGISHQMSAFQTYRSLAMLAAITGNIGRPGTGCNFMHNTWPGGLNLAPVQHQVPERPVALPVGPDWFAESILEARPYRLRALVTEGNPIIGCSNTNKVRDALHQLEFYVFTGLYMEEAAWYADVLLPVTSGLEVEGVYMRRDDRAIRWQEAAVPRVGSCRTDVEIWIDLATRMEAQDSRQPQGYWTRNLPREWRDYGKLWETFVQNTPGMGGMTQERMQKRDTPLQWPCPTEQHPGVSTLYLDHPSWYQAAEALDPGYRGKRFLTPSGKVEIFTPDIQARLASVGHSALPVFYTHPHVTGDHPTARHSRELVPNPVNPRALTPRAEIGSHPDQKPPRGYPLMGMIGRSSVVHFAGVTQWTRLGKRLNGIRLIQIHPETAARSGIQEGETIRVESPVGSLSGTALLWKGMRPDTIFVPNSFGNTQVVGDEVGVPRYEPANVLVDDLHFDNLSGQQAYKCFACRISKA